MLPDTFFNRPALELAPDLLGKVIRHRFKGVWLSARIIETEAYMLTDKGSHASLGYTEKRQALFKDGGTIYMYYSRGGDSVNFSAKGEGNAVLIKSGYPYFDALSPESTLSILQANNPDRQGQPRPVHKLCSGQTLLCKSLGLKVPDWDNQHFTAQRFYVEDCGLRPREIIQARRLGISQGRDEHLPYRFVDADYATCCTKNPLRRGQIEGQDFWRLTDGQAPVQA
jgi:DNA-3-methyladenine glycosylase